MHSPTVPGSKCMLIAYRVCAENQSELLHHLVEHIVIPSASMIPNMRALSIPFDTSLKITLILAPKSNILGGQTEFGQIIFGLIIPTVEPGDQDTAISFL